MSDVHSMLITESARWLQKTKRCSVIITDMTHSACETADAIGWYGWSSILIECKASMGDFRADAKKAFRACPDRGMGHFRYYCAPRGMIRPEQLPEGWGLLEWNGTKLVETVKAETQYRLNLRAELSLLLSAIRRIGANAPQGVSVRCYTYETKNRATLGVDISPEE